jgi:hypothetical protein
MASSQAILSALTNMQANTQAALPVIPNNGNPGGAYNQAAPQPVGQPEQIGASNTRSGPLYAPKMAQGYEWLKPSPYMDMVNSYLSQRPQFKSAASAAIQPPEVTQAPATVPNVGLPTLPQRFR